MLFFPNLVPTPRQTVGNFKFVEFLPTTRMFWSHYAGFAYKTSSFLFRNVMFLIRKCRIARFHIVSSSALRRDYPSPGPSWIGRINNRKRTEKSIVASSVNRTEYIMFHFRLLYASRGSSDHNAITEYAIRLLAG